MGHVSALPWEAWLAAAQVLALVFWKPLSGLTSIFFGARSREQLRIEHLEDAIDELRRALDKGRVRESAVVAVCELLIFAIDHVQDASSAVLNLRGRALEVLELAQAHLKNFDRGDK